MYPANNFTLSCISKNFLRTIRKTKKHIIYGSVVVSHYDCDECSFGVVVHRPLSLCQIDFFFSMKILPLKIVCFFSE